MSPTRLSLAVAAACLAVAGIAMAAPQTTKPAATPAKVKLDANNDGVIDRAEAAKHPRLAERFDQLDANKDGRLSADERPQRGMKRGGKRGDRGHRGGMDQKMQLDADKDGRISRAEAAKQPKLAERFTQMDVNKDGFLDRTDREARMSARRAEWFSAADTNRDGQISRAEYDAAQSKRQADRQQKQAAGKRDAR
ncbi:MAG: EF-hand domain-containing protein [Xanthomonadaceae bacterium]|nr:EF-hand domain-containing protein [Xanthomonadaceae bacterium]